MKAITTLLLLILSYSICAQITISGKVTDQSGIPLLGVNVYLNGTYDGATTNVDGQFSFETYETDRLILIATFIGFHKSEIPIAPKSQQFDIALKEQIDQLNAVVITAGTFNAAEGSKQEVLKPLDIVTTAGATADIPGALNTLPGTQAVGETGRLFVRGGDGRETKTFIDGMLVHNEYSPSAPNTPGRSRFSPFMFKGTNFSTGGYSAEYGQALSSALILNSKDLSENDRTDISLMTVGLDLSTTQSFEKSSIAGKVQYTNLTPYFAWVKQNLKWEQAPEQFDGNFAYRQKTSKTGLLKVYSNLSTSAMALYEPDIANPELLLPVKVTNDYTHINTSYRELLNKKWGLRAGLSLTKSNDFVALDQTSREEDLFGFHAKVAFDHQYSDRLSITTGGEIMGRNFDQKLNDNSRLPHGFNERISASFMEAEFFASSALAFKVGVRGEYSSLGGQLNLNPRISTAYKTGSNSQISIAFGQFHQAPSRQILFTDTDAPHENNQHYIANCQWVNGGRSFRIEAYEKRYGQLARYSDLSDLATYRFDGNGHARGVDLFWRDTQTFKNTDYWISYSYLDTERLYQDFPDAHTPSFASTHNFSVVVKKFINSIKSQVGCTYSFASPRTFNDPNNDQFLSGRTPSYHDLSFNISYLYSNQIIIHAMVNNALGINNIFGYEFASEPNENGSYASRPITPAAPRFIFLGVFITLSKNKGINQLPNL